MLDELEQKLAAMLDVVYPDIDTAYLAKQLMRSEEHTSELQSPSTA